MYGDVINHALDCVRPLLNVMWTLPVEMLLASFAECCATDTVHAAGLSSTQDYRSVHHQHICFLCRRYQTHPFALLLTGHARSLHWPPRPFPPSCVSQGSSGSVAAKTTQSSAFICVNVCLYMCYRSPPPFLFPHFLNPCPPCEEILHVPILEGIKIQLQGNTYRFFFPLVCDPCFIAELIHADV